MSLMYSDLLRTARILSSFKTDNNMTNWEVKIAKMKSLKSGMKLIDSYKWVVSARDSRGSLAGIEGDLK